MDTGNMATGPDASVLSFTVETRGARGWRPFLGHYDDFFKARKTAASLTASQGVEARVTDSDGRVWA